MVKTLCSWKQSRVGPVALPSVLATMLTPSFYPCLHGSLPVCEAAHEVRVASGKFPSRPTLLRWGIGVLRARQSLHLMELGAAQKTPSESQAGKAGVMAA